MNKKLILLFLIFLVLQSFMLFSVLPSDNSVYMMMANEITKGNLPHVDFFHAHSSVHLFLYAGLIKLFGLHIWILKLFTLLIWMGCGYMTYLLAKERYDERIGFVAVLLFLISYDSIFASFSFGIELSVLFFLISWYILNKKPVLSGILFGFCLMIRLHLLPLGIILWLYSKEKRKFLFGSGICIIYYGLMLRVPNFFIQVFGYHAGKLAHTNGWLSFLRANLILFILMVYSIKNVKDLITFEFTLSYVAFLLIVSSVFEYFFLIIGIFLCIESAYALTYSRFKKILWVVVIVWTTVMFFKVGSFVYEQTNSFNDYIDYVETIDGEIMGESSLASLIALRTNKTIHNLEIDMNFQRRKTYNFSGSLVVYNEKVFNGLEFNCTLINSTTIKGDTYKLWGC